MHLHRHFNCMDAVAHNPEPSGSCVRWYRRCASSSRWRRNSLSRAIGAGDDEWAPGQRTPIHDHGTWGVVGILDGRRRRRHAFVHPRRIRRWHWQNKCRQGYGRHPSYRTDARRVRSAATGRGSNVPPDPDRVHETVVPTNRGTTPESCTCYKFTERLSCLRPGGWDAPARPRDAYGDWQQARAPLRCLGSRDPIGGIVPKTSPKAGSNHSATPSPFSVQVMIGIRGSSASEDSVRSDARKAAAMGETSSRARPTIQLRASTQPLRSAIMSACNSRISSSVVSSSFSASSPTA